MANIFSASFAHNFTGLPHSYTNSATTSLGFSVKSRNMTQIANGLMKSDLFGQILAVKSLDAVRIPFKSARLSGNAFAAAVTEKSIHDFTVKDIDGKDVPLSKFKGKVLLAVNVASRCGLTTSNYSELSHLYEKYKTQGFEILAFPCNQFGGQEPGTNPQIKEFACTRFKAEFPIFDKVDVNGPSTAPVYQFLKSSKGGGLLEGHSEAASCITGVFSGSSWFVLSEAVSLIIDWYQVCCLQKHYFVFKDCLY